MTEREVVIVDGCRTAFGKKGGGLRGFAASELGGICVKALMERSGIVERGGKVDFYFRVLAPVAGKVEIIARDGDTVLARRVAPYVNPGEMEHLSPDVTGVGSLTIEVKEV